jgi:hypothetical protein
MLHWMPALGCFTSCLGPDAKPRKDHITGDSGTYNTLVHVSICEQHTADGRHVSRGAGVETAQNILREPRNVGRRLQL